MALVAAVIPGRGHAFFKGWLEKLAGYLLRKAAYSLILATLLAVNGALAGATEQLGWLMSFGMQALFFWAVFLQRKNLTESLIGIATGPGAPGRDNTLRLLALYAGARTLRRPFSGSRRSGRAGADAPVRGVARTGANAPKPGTAAPAPRLGTSHSAPVGGGVPSLDRPGPSERRSRPSQRPQDPDLPDPATAPTRPSRARGRRQGSRKAASPARAGPLPSPAGKPSGLRRVSARSRFPSASPARTVAARTQPSVRARPARRAPSASSSARSASGAGSENSHSGRRESRVPRRPRRRPGVGIAGGGRGAGDERGEDEEHRPLGARRRGGHEPDRGRHRRDADGDPRRQRRLPWGQRPDLGQPADPRRRQADPG